MKTFLLSLLLSFSANALVVITDAHIYGADPTTDVRVQPENVLKLAKNTKDYVSDVIILGDYFDYKNAEKDKVFEVKWQIALFKERFEDRYVRGNHDGLRVPMELYFRNGWLFTHGDFLFWGEKLATERRDTEPGCSKFLRFFKKLGSEYRNHFDINIDNVNSDEFQKNVRDLIAKYHPKGIVIGHKHPLKKLTIYVDGVPVIILPRGWNELPELL